MKIAIIVLALLQGCAAPQNRAATVGAGTCRGSALGCMASAWTGKGSMITPGQSVREAIDRNERAGGAHQEYPCFDESDSRAVPCPAKEESHVQR